MIQREHIQNLAQIISIEQKEHFAYDDIKIPIAQYQDIQITFSNFLFAKNRGWTKLGGHNEIDINYIKLLPFILSIPDEIYKNIDNDRLIFVLDIDIKHKIFHIIDTDGSLLSIFIIRKKNFLKQINKRFVKKNNLPGGTAVPHILIDIISSCQPGSCQKALWRQANILEQLYQNFIFKSSYTNKSYAKINVFLKIVGKKDNYHLIISRFLRVQKLYDIIEFQNYDCDTFTLEGNFGCETKKNTIYKAYTKLKDISPLVKQYFKTHKIVVQKTIPEFAGLGGGSSNCATFILMVNDVCNLELSKDKMAQIGATIGADVPFFIYEYDSANVSGIGEIVQKFDEQSLNIEVFTPKIKCDTAKIFTTFRDDFYQEISQEKSEVLQNMKSVDILNQFSKEYLNDLYLPAVKCENKLKKFAQKDYFFSGSGSSFFKLG